MENSWYAFDVRFQDKDSEKFSATYIDEAFKGKFWVLEAEEAEEADMTARGPAPKKSASGAKLKPAKAGAAPAPSAKSPEAPMKRTGVALADYAKSPKAAKRK